MDWKAKLDQRVNMEVRLDRNSTYITVIDLVIAYAAAIEWYRVDKG